MPLFRKKKVLCSLGAGAHRELLALSRTGFADYARRHGYDFVVEHELLDASRPAAWSKVQLILRLLPRYRSVVWIDADAMIVDSTRDVVDDLPRDATLGLVAHRTMEGDQIPNFGLLVIRSNRKAKEFFELLWQQTAFIHHKWWENGAALALFGFTTEPPVQKVGPSRYFDMVHLLDGAWNSLSIDPVPRPRIVHFAGQPHDVRLAGMTSLLRDTAPQLPL